MDDDGKYIVEAITNSNVIAVSNGSNKNIGAYACVIEGPAHNTHHIMATVTTPDPPHLHDAYRSGLAGLYQIVAITNKICMFYNISTGSITVACDGLNATKKTMAEDTTYSCQSNHFDIILDINHMISISSITWRWQHAKGHQDNIIGSLDRWALLNVEMDIKAKARRRADEVDPPPIQQEDTEAMSLIHQDLHERLTHHYQQGIHDIPHNTRFLCNNSLTHLHHHPTSTVPT
eukprot:10528378-Ditylum_brightwellii.AAC.1